MRSVGPFLLLFGFCISLFGSSDQDCEEFFDLESQGRFQDASALLRGESNSCSSQGSHVARLRALARIERSIETNPDVMSAERAQDLRAFMQKLDAQREQPLMQGAYVLLDKLSANAESVADSPFGRFIRELRASVKNGNPGQLPIAPALTLAWQSLRCFLVIAIIVFLFWRVWPRKGIQISFEEITGDQSKKPVLDRVLMQEVQQAFWIPRTELTERGPEGLELAPVKDRDASGFGSLVPQRPLIPWSDVVQSGTPIRLGPVTFDLKQTILFLLSPLQIRRRYSLVGFLHESEERTLIMAQEVDWKGRQLRGCSWKAERDSKSTRRDMIQDLAAQVIVDLRVSEITTDWRSYRYFCRGLDSLAAANAAGSRGQCQCIDSAREQFQIALGLDPANWMARFYLAVCLCRCGENEAAVSHFGILENVLSESDALLTRRRTGFRRAKQPSTPIIRHLQQYPQCPFLVLYNKAMALSGTLRSCELQQALAAVNRIRQAVERGPKHEAVFANCANRLTDLDRGRFAMLALSARTSILATQIEYQLRYPGIESQLLALRTEIDGTVDEFEVKFRHLRPELLAAHALAHATMLNAKGRAMVACFSARHQSPGATEARAYFEQAAACLPDLIDSHLNLAKLYLRAKRELSTNWIAESEKQLRLAQRLDPENIQVKYLQSKLASAAEVRNYDGALSILRQLPDIPETYFLQAEILSNPLFAGRDVTGAIRAWEKATSLLSEPNQAQVEHLLNLFEFTRESPDLLSFLCPVATEGAQRLREGGKCASERGLGADWLKRFESVPEAA